MEKILTSNTKKFPKHSVLGICAHLFWSNPVVLDGLSVQVLPDDAAVFDPVDEIRTCLFARICYY